MILYHATRYENLTSILASGLEPRNMERGTYFTNKPEYAAGFLKLHLADDIVVFAVDTDDLEPERLQEGVDHNPIFFPDDMEVWLYLGHIEPELLLDDEILRYDLREQRDE